MTGQGLVTERAQGAFPLRRFVATRISLAIEDDLRRSGGGLVEGIHRSAVNIRWRDQLVTVAHESLGGLPNGVLLDPPLALDQMGITHGMPVQCDRSVLRIPGASVAVLLAGAATWSPAMPVVHGMSIDERVERATRAVELAAQLAPRVGLGPLLVGIADGRTNVGSLGRAAARSVAKVLVALNRGTSQDAIAAALPIIGLGPGATPSGDDLLVGLAAGLAVTDHPLARPFAAGIADAAGGLTTSVAETYLHHAGRLEFSERVHQAALAVLRAPETELRHAVNAALAWGASSGADLLVGLLIGIQAPAPGLAKRLRSCADEGTVAA